MTRQANQGGPQTPGAAPLREPATAPVRGPGGRYVWWEVQRWLHSNNVWIWDMDAYTPEQLEDALVYCDAMLEGRAHPIPRETMPAQRNIWVEKAFSREALIVAGRIDTAHALWREVELLVRENARYVTGLAFYRELVDEDIQTHRHQVQIKTITKREAHTRRPSKRVWETWQDDNRLEFIRRVAYYNPPGQASFAFVARPASLQHASAVQRLTAGVAIQAGQPVYINTSGMVEPTGTGEPVGVALEDASQYCDVTISTNL